LVALEGFQGWMNPMGGCATEPAEKSLSNFEDAIESRKTDMPVFYGACACCELTKVNLGCLERPKFPRAQGPCLRRLPKKHFRRLREFTDDPSWVHWRM